MLEKCHKLQQMPKKIDEFKVALQAIWVELPQEHINKAVTYFTKHLTACVAAISGQFEYMQYYF